MIITYLILVSISILFKIMHWPGASLFLLISPLLPTVDILIQALRKKEDKIFRILSSVAFMGASVFILFKMLSWSGSFLMFVVFIICCIPLLIIAIIKGFNKFKGYRKYSLIILLLFSSYTLSLSPSRFQLTFMIENPFDEKEMVPPFIRHKLSFNLFQEGEKEKALVLLKITLKDLEKNCLEFSNETICELNKKQVKTDIEAVKANNWMYTNQLYY